MRKIVYTKALINLIVGCIFDGLTDEETACLAHIPTKTVSRLRCGEEFPQIREATIERMRKYVALIRDHPEDRTNRWQRIAWFLERRYPDRWSKPEVLLNVNTAANSITNNTLVITAEVAQNLKNRNANLSQELDKLSPPASRTGPIIPIMSPEHLEGNVRGTKEILTDDLSTSKTSSDSVVLATPPAPTTRTPDAAVGTPDPNLPPKSKILEPFKTKSKSVENSRNYRGIGGGGIDEKIGITPHRGRPRKIPQNFPKKLEPVQALDSLDKKSEPAGMVAAGAPLPKKRHKAPPKVLRGPGRPKKVIK